jgi:hypothetical protein
MTYGIEEEVPEVLWQQLQGIRARLDKEAPLQIGATEVEGSVEDMGQLGSLMLEKIIDGEKFYRLPTVEELDVIIRHVAWYMGHLTHIKHLSEGRES